MINKKIDINCKTINGIRPIHYICKYGSLETIKFMICQGVDITCSTNEGKYYYDFLMENIDNTSLILKHYIENVL